MIPFLLAFLGLICIAAEFYLPGAVCAILGALFLVLATVLFAMAGYTQNAFFLFIFALLLGVIGVVWGSLRFIATKGISLGIRNDDSQEGFVAVKPPPSLRGKKGVVLSDLRPGGYVLVDGKKWPAQSVGGYVSQGEEITVLGEEENFLKVYTASRKES